MSRPLVSVIMPAYNTERYIEAAVRSVMAQTVTDWELLVLDDCSVDSTCAIAGRLAAEDPRIRLLRGGQNSGVAAVRNWGLTQCRGAYIAFLDSDDLWHPDKLERQLRLMESTGADLCYSAYAIINGAGERVGQPYLVPGRVDFEALLRENVIGCSTVVLRRQTAGNYRFCTDFYHEDYILWLQLLRDGRKAAGCVEILADWRYIPGSRSFNKLSSAKNRWRIYRKYLGLSIGKSIRCFAGYAAAGLKKYSSKSIKS